MDGLSFLLGAGGLSVAALSLWLTYRERGRWYREHLYGKQADAILHVYEAAANLQAEIGVVALRSDDANARGKRFRDSDHFGPIRAYQEALRKVDHQWAPLIPKSVLLPFLNYDASVSFLLGTPPEWGLSAEQGYGEDPYISAEWYHGTDKCFEELAIAIRKYLAAERLDAETLKLLGVRISPADRARRLTTED